MGETRRSAALLGGKRTASLAGGLLQVWGLNEEEGLVYLINDTEVYVPTATDLSSLVRVDLSPPASTLLVQSGPPSFGDVAWEDPAFLQLRDENGELWRYTFTTQDLEKEP